MDKSIPAPTLIYCGGGNYRFYEIATNCGFKYGVQLPDQVHGELYFADQNWKKPNREKYIQCIQKHKPYMATVLDLERQSQFREVLDWAEEISQFVELIQIIPKVKNIIKKIPPAINGKKIILGYSVPTSYGKTDVALDEFQGWDIHLLGGTPHKQYEIWNLVKHKCTVRSIDGNYYRLKATKFCEHWEAPGKWVADGHKHKNDAHYDAFRQSCQNISRFWKDAFKRKP
jgi:hypothetical protein